MKIKNVTNLFLIFDTDKCVDIITPIRKFFNYFMVSYIRTVKTGTKLLQKLLFLDNKQFNFY